MVLHCPDMAAQDDDSYWSTCMTPSMQNSRWGSGAQLHPFGDMMDGVEMFLQKYHMCVKIVM